MAAHIAGAHFIVAHVHEKADAAGVRLFDAPADDVQIRGLAGQITGDLDPEIGAARPVCATQKSVRKPLRGIRPSLLHPRVVPGV